LATILKLRGSPGLVLDKRSYTVHIQATDHDVFILSTRMYPVPASIHARAQLPFLESFVLYVLRLIRLLCVSSHIGDSLNWIQSAEIDVDKEWKDELINNTLHRLRLIEA